MQHLLREVDQVQMSSKIISWARSASINSFRLQQPRRPASSPSRATRRASSLSKTPTPHRTWRPKSAKILCWPLKDKSKLRTRLCSKIPRGCASCAKRTGSKIQPRTRTLGASGKRRRGERRRRGVPRAMDAVRAIVATARSVVRGHETTDVDRKRNGEEPSPTRIAGDRRTPTTNGADTKTIGGEGSMMCGPTRTGPRDQDGPTSIAIGTDPVRIEMRRATAHAALHGLRTIRIATSRGPMNGGFLHLAPRRNASRRGLQQQKRKKKKLRPSWRA